MLIYCKRIQVNSKMYNFFNVANDGFVETIEGKECFKITLENGPNKTEYEVKLILFKKDLKGYFNRRLIQIPIQKTKTY
jgi:hypothetical protein